MAPDVLDQLEQQHREAEDLLAQMEDAEEESEQRPLVERLLAAMAEHMEIEEREVYPELKKLDAEMDEEARIEHDLARQGLATLEQMIGKPGFGAAVAMVQAGIEHHVEEEEGEAFPKLREALGLPASTRRSGGRSRGRRSTGTSDDASKAELYEEAKQAGIEGRSSMTKEELAAALHR